MKPLNLIIEGLNSFEQPELIDFEQLMEPGLFGIFGPTGSGKSSIIDGLTLALFGDISRGSKNFINVNVDKCHVILEFQIASDTSKRYKVSRSYKRDSETGNARADKARLEYMVEAGQSEILADQTRTVDKECSMILGLSKDDFTRTVVLPQGKFSEFLQMGGKDRTDMLERIFQLEKFGVKLDRRVKSHRNKIDENVKVLEGKSQTYEDVSPEKLKEKQEEYYKKETELKETEEKIILIKNFVKKWEDVREAQRKQEQNRIHRTELQMREPEIEELKRQLEKARIANELYVLYQDEKLSAKKYLVVKQDSNEKQLQKVQMEEEVLEAKAKVESCEQRFYEEKPKLESNLAQINVAIEKVKGLKLLEAKLQQDIENQKQSRLTQEHLQQQISEKNAQLKQVKAQLKCFEEEKARRFHSQQEKNLVETGANSEREITRLEKAIGGIKASQSDQLNKKNELKDKNQKLSTELTDKKAELVKLKKLLIEIESELFSFLDIAEEKMIIERASVAQQTEKEVKQVLETITVKLESATIEMKELKKLEQTLQLEREVVQFSLEKIQEQTLVQKLVIGLKEGDHCPVCDGTYYTKIEEDFCDEQKLLEEEEDLKLQITVIDQRLNDVKERQGEAQTNKNTSEFTIRAEEDKRSRLNQELLGVNLKQKEEELSALIEKKQSLEMKQREIRELRDERKEKVSEAYNTIGKNQILLSSMEVRQEELEQTMLDLIEQTGQQSKIRNQCLTRIRVDSFVQQWQKIGADTEQYEIVEKQLRLGNQELEGIAEHIQKKSGENEKLKQNCIRYEESETAHRESLAIIHKELKDTVETWEDLPRRKKAILDRIQLLQEEFETAKNILGKSEEKKDKTTDEYQKLSVEVGKNEGIFHSNRERLETRMKKSAVTDRAWILLNQKEKSFISNVEQEVKKYEEEVLHIGKLLQELEEWLAGRSISEKEWIEKTSRYEELVELQKQQNSNYSVLQSELLRMEKDLEQLNTILKDLEEAEHQKSLILELEKLLRGKAFVRFASMYYLKFVTKDANRRLHEMTNGNYELELSENCEFLMRDYKNGGKIRSCTTLSGGETFVVSLALSKQIQLKGDTSIDLFFLDEGFGTLDERFIDVVMDSLYRLRERGLNVGLITHVEAIRDKVGARILVTAAESGGKGSKIALEFN